MFVKNTHQICYNTDRSQLVSTVLWKYNLAIFFFQESLSFTISEIEGFASYLATNEWKILKSLIRQLSEVDIQSTLVISKSKGLSEILRDIRTSTYQICRIEEKINRTTTFNKYICNLTPEKEYIENIEEKKINCSLGAFLFFSQYFITCC